MTSAQVNGATDSRQPRDCDATKCVCGSEEVSVIGALPFYMPAGQVESDVYRCSACGTLFRELDPSSAQLQAHFDVASYTREVDEPAARSARLGFFGWLLHLYEEHGGPARIRDGTFLDIGCAYGHLLDAIRDHGGQPEGVEVVSRLRESAESRGFPVYRSIDELAPSASPQRYDGVFLIDSLYYIQDPTEFLASIRPVLRSSESKVVIRVTNRAWIIRLRAAMGLGFTSTQFGDSKWCFSYRGIKLAAENAGLEITSVILHERGKRGMSWQKWAYYQITGLLSLAGIRLTPGIILICKPRGPFDQTASS